MESLGPFLKRAREHAGITLEELAEKTRIRVENIRALESEKLAELPNELYVRGFVKLICRELELSADEGILRYEILKEGTSPPDEIVWADVREDAAPGAVERALADPARILERVQVGARVTLFALGGLFVALSVVFAARIFTREPAVASVGSGLGSVGKDPGASGADTPGRQEKGTETGASAGEGAEPAEETDGSPSPESLPQGSFALQTPTTPSATVDAAESEREKGPSPASSPSTGRAQAGSPPKEPSASGARSEQGATAEESAARQPPAQRDEAAGGKEPPGSEESSARPGSRGGAYVPKRPGFELLGPSAVPGRQLELRLEATRDVEVRILLDGQGLPRERKLVAGETGKWKASKSFLLSASDAGAFRVYLEGVEVGPIGLDHVPIEQFAIGPESR
jgi:cytoskeletal protein RodZ